MKSFDSLPYSVASIDALVKKVLRHPTLAQVLAERIDRTTERQIEYGMEKNDDELIGPLL